MGAGTAGHIATESSPSEIVSPKSTRSYLSHNMYVVVCHLSPSTGSVAYFLYSSARLLQSFMIEGSSKNAVQLLLFARRDGIVAAYV